MVRKDKISLSSDYLLEKRIGLNNNIKYKRIIEINGLDVDIR